MLNVAVVAPAAMFTVPGTPTEAELLDRDTVIPVAGAGAFSVIVPMALVPPVTLVGEIERLEMR